MKMERIIGNFGLLDIGLGVVQTGIENSIKVMVTMMGIMLWIGFEEQDG